jgi:hypothetical protein
MGYLHNLPNCIKMMANAKDSQIRLAGFITGVDSIFHVLPGRDAIGISSFSDSFIYDPTFSVFAARPGPRQTGNGGKRYNVW